MIPDCMLVCSVMWFLVIVVAKRISFLRWSRPPSLHGSLGITCTQQKTILFLPAIKLEPSGTDDVSESVVEFGIT